MVIYGKMGEPPFLGFPKVWYWHQTVWYRYHIDFGRLVPIPNFRYRYPMFCFGSVLVCLPYLGHFLSDLSDSSGWLNSTLRRKNLPEIGTFKFGLYLAHKFSQSGAMFKPIFGSVLNIE